MLTGRQVCSTPPDIELLTVMCPRIEPRMIIKPPNSRAKLMSKVEAVCKLVHERTLWHCRGVSLECDWDDLEEDVDRNSD